MHARHSTGDPRDRGGYASRETFDGRILFPVIFGYIFFFGRVNVQYCMSSGVYTRNMRNGMSGYGNMYSPYESSQSCQGYADIRGGLKLFTRNLELTGN